MIETNNQAFSYVEKASNQIPPMLDRVLAAARSDAVYSQPIISGNDTVITASEVTAGGGFGSGIGFGPGMSPPEQEQSSEEGSSSEQADSGGGGLGGGGGSAGRPVAIIIIGPDGVTVKPVFDLTKIALAGVTAGITLLTMFRRVRRARRR